MARRSVKYIALIAFVGFGAWTLFSNVRVAAQADMPNAANIAQRIAGYEKWQQVNRVNKEISLDVLSIEQSTGGG